MLTKTDEYFITIAKTGNLNQASKILYVSQPSLSKYIQRLEERIGTQLFDHSVTPLRLNDAGKLYLNFLLQTQEQENVFLTQIDEISTMERGNLRVGIPTYCGQCYLPRILPRFSSRYPNVKINLLETNGSHIENALLNQEIDLGILHYPILNPALKYEEVIKERVLMVKKGSGKRLLLSSLNIDSFAQEKFILPMPNQKIFNLVNSFLANCSFVPQVYLQTHNAETTIRLAAEGLGIGFVIESGLNELSSSILERVDFYSLDHNLDNWKILAATRKNYILRSFENFFITIFRQCDKN